MVPEFDIGLNLEKPRPSPMKQDEEEELVRFLKDYI
jgi:hypothetical protein